MKRGHAWANWVGSLGACGVVLGAASAHAADASAPAVASPAASPAAAPAAAPAAPTVSQCLEASESATTLRHAHSLIESRAQFVTCAAATCPADVRNECLRQVDQVNALVPAIVLEVKDAAGQELTHVAVSMDGKPWLSSLDGTEQPLDPGARHFEFFVDGASIAKRDLVIHEGEKSRREAIVLPPVSSTNQQMSTAGTTTPRAWQKPLGEGLAVLGIVGVGVGTYFGLHAISKSSSSKDECESTNNCTNRAAAQNDHDSASSSATASTVAFGVGAAALAAGIILFVTAPAERTPDATAAGSQARQARQADKTLRWTPMIGGFGMKSAGLSLGGTFE